MKREGYIITAVIVLLAAGFFWATTGTRTDTKNMEEDSGNLLQEPLVTSTPPVAMVLERAQPTLNTLLWVKKEGSPIGTACTIDVSAENRGTSVSAAKLTFNGIAWSFELQPKGKRTASINIPFYAQDGWINVAVRGDIDGFAINETERIHCSGSSGGDGKLSASGASTTTLTATPTVNPTVTATITATAAPTPTATVDPTATATQPPSSIPEFPNIGLPILAVLGLLILFRKLKR